MTQKASPASAELDYAIETHGQLDPWLGREWLLTNGMGGFASSTVIGCNTRRYHGLLVAAMRPPVGRCMLLNRVGEILRFDGNDQPPIELSVNQFRDVFHPRGDRYLRRFVVGRTARWEFEVEGVRIDKEVLLTRHRNIVGIRYRLDAGSKPNVQMQCWPFVSLRDFHALRKAGASMHVESDASQVAVADGQLRLQMRAAGATFVSRGDWWRDHTYAVETERGQDDSEDLYTPGFFQFQLNARQPEMTLWAGCEDLQNLDWQQEFGKLQGIGGTSAAGGAGPSPGRGRPGSPGDAPSPAIRHLMRAAEDFVVQRRQADGSPGCTILAGYPWFSDWGRDTMISLPGLLLCTGRLPEATQVLCTFAQHVSQGMIPNVFNDYTNEPSYNTVDASLWFIHAAHEYQRLGGQADVFTQRLLPACRAIIEGYQKGTRFNIGMDPADGLIHAGDSQTQLTWMDAKCGGIAFTPRQGKAVEINALWYHALQCMGQAKLAARVRTSFVKTFWQNPFRGLFDVVDGNRRDASIRPNQIFAVSLPHSPLNLEQQQSVVDEVRRELLTPMGLRTLAAGQPGYRGRYGGPQMQRDAAYHNGTVWAWLLGPFVEAYLRINDRSPSALAQARLWLTPLIDLMSQGGPCLGQISEVFEGDAPHRPVGCFAQAWSVAEVLRLAVEVGM